MVYPAKFSAAALHKQYENESPEDKAARLEANRQRIEHFVKSWNEFREKYPEEARRMVCAA